MTSIEEIAQIESDMELCRVARLIDALKRSLTR